MMVSMNLLVRIADLVDPANRYFVRAEKERPPRISLEDFNPPDPADLPGWRVEAAEPDPARALDKATETLLEDGAVKVRTAQGIVAAKLIRFWTGSAILDVRSIGSADWGRRISRLRQRPRTGMPPPMDMLEHEIRSRLKAAVEESAGT